MDEVTVFDPRGRVDAERVELAPRAGALGGLRLGILDNTKWNANRLLRKTAALLVLQEGKLLEIGRAWPDRRDRREQRHRPDRDRRLRVVYVVLYA